MQIAGHIHRRLLNSVHSRRVVCGLQSRRDEFSASSRVAGGSRETKDKRSGWQSLRSVKGSIAAGVALLCGANAHAFDLDEAPDTNIQITPKLSVSVQLELKSELQKNYDLNSDTPNDISTVEPTLSFALSYRFNDRLSLFAYIEPTKTFVNDNANEKEDESALEFTEMFLMFSNLLGSLDIKLGRQKFKDDRQWLYDEELDGIRILYPYSKWAFETWVAELNNRDLLHGGEDEHVTYYELRLSYEPVEDSVISGYAFVRDDRTTENESPIFYGTHAGGELENDRWDLEYWLDLARVEGDSGSHKIRGGGIDVGFTYQWNVPLQPSVTLDYAFGSGDDGISDGIDRNFRQSGLQDNSAKFGGVNKIEYYGELFDPELSNLRIFTAGIGIRPTDRPKPKTSIELVYHKYEQAVAVDELRDAGVNQDPNGEDKNIGSEIDLIFGYRSLDERIKGSLVFGYFMPGDAFSDDADSALFTKLKLQYAF